MKKILILSYFFQPCNLTASRRVSGFAEHFHKFDIYPIIITRNWDISIEKPEDVLKSTGSDVIHIKTSNYEVYYLPYRSNLRDKVFLNSHNNLLFKYLSKILTIISMVGELFSTKFIPYNNLYKFTYNYLKKNKDIDLVFTSANPFNQFKFGHLLSKKLNINWIADYRDSWTTNKMATQVRGINYFLYKLQEKFEKKWVSTAKVFTTVSDEYVLQIEKFVKTPGYTILNGYDYKLTPEKNNDKSTFKIVFNGTMYYNQPIEEFIDAINTINKTSEVKIHVYFPGLAFEPKQAKRVESCIVNNEKYFHIYNWLPKEYVLQIQKDADLLLMLSYKGFKGIPSSKLYEYIGAQKNILLYPSDNDIIESILLKTGLGLICNTKDEIISAINELINNKLEDKISTKINQDQIDFYSRENQTKLLSNIIKNII
jgi:glycosyltransferase involved in cell wall biosynthesis